MQECELCGRKTETAYLVDIDNVELGVCARCAKGKHIIAELSERKPAKKSAIPGIAKSRDDDILIVENYGDTIRKAREHMKLPLKVLAEMLNEKEGLLLRIEEQKTLPPDELRKKLERALAIKLVETPDLGGQSQYHGAKTEEATLGEFVK